MKHFIKKLKSIQKDYTNLPNLIDIQKKSFDQFLGLGNYKEEMLKSLERHVDEGTRKLLLDSKELLVLSGIEKVLKQSSPMHHTNGCYTVTFDGYKLEEPKHTFAECVRKKITYGRDLFIKATLYIKENPNDEKPVETKEANLYVGNVPVMNDQGTFLIKNTERILLAQIVRSPGFYLTKNSKNGVLATLLPSNGAWLDIMLDGKGNAQVSIDKRRKVPLITFLLALGFSKEEIEAELGEYDVVKQLLEKNSTLLDKKQAASYILTKSRGWDSFDNSANISFIENTFFSKDKYSLGYVGRYKLNEIFNTYKPIHQTNLDREDIMYMMHYVFSAFSKSNTFKYGEENTEVELHDIDSLENRRIKLCGELLYNQMNIGMSKVQRILQEKIIDKNHGSVTVQSLVNIRPIISAIREFFNTSQFSQFLDQTNPLAMITHKRRISAIGPGGLTRERANIDIRDVNKSHYGRICPIETPEGPNIGLINAISTYANVDYFGFLITPYYRVRDRYITEELVYLSSHQERYFKIADNDVKVDKDNYIIDDNNNVRLKDSLVELRPSNEIDFVDVSAIQSVSIATSLIPFLQHNDAKRALMGANMMRQAISLVKTESPIIGTGMESVITRDSDDMVRAEEDGFIVRVQNESLLVRYENFYKEYYVPPLRKSNQNTIIKYNINVQEEDRVKKGDILAQSNSVQDGELAIGKNILVALMPWRGYNYEDAIIVSDSLVQHDALSSIKIEQYSIEVRNTKLGAEETMLENLHGISSKHKAKLDENGIIKTGSYVSSGDVLVGKTTPRGEADLTPEERLLKEILGKRSVEVKDTSLYMPHGESGKVIRVEITEQSEEKSALPSDVIREVTVYIAKKRYISVGDKLSGRYGNKGVISAIVPSHDMPYMSNGRRIDMIINPLGVPNRMNIGQILELHLAWVAKHGFDISGIEESEFKERMRSEDLLTLPRNSKLRIPIFYKFSIDDIKTLLANTLKTEDGKALPVGDDGKCVLYDGITGEEFNGKITVGYMYILKLHHLVDDKLHARSIGPYSMVTQQPLGGRAQFGGQRFGEMEVWAIEAYGAAFNLLEFLTIKSDDISGRINLYKAKLENKHVYRRDVPESFKVLIKELQALACDISIKSYKKIEQDSLVIRPEFVKQKEMEEEKELLGKT
jgi:DNA-directed RNA polymerase subunit beta